MLCRFNRHPELVSGSINNNIRYLSFRSSDSARRNLLSCNITPALCGHPDPHLHRDDRQERGAVFIYILIAIALFASLSYFISKGNRGSSNIFTEEQAKLAAQEIIDYGNTVAAAVQKLRLRGIAETDIGFDNNIYFRMNGTLLNPIGENSNCSDDYCQVFNKSGGNVNAVTFANLGVDDTSFSPTWGKSGHAIFRTINIDGIGTTDNDLTMEILSIPRDVCYEINDILNTIISNQSPVETYGNSGYGGSFSNTTNTIGDESGLNGKQAFCIQNATYGHFIQVLLAR